MRILVYDVAAESGGALTVLKDFYNEFKLDLSNNYVIVLSTAILDKCENIEILNFPWIKNSWVHRIFFDHLYAPKILLEYKIDKIISLQNTIVPHTRLTQSVFVHNALPFTEYKIKMKDDVKIWVYQNLIGRLIKSSIKNADQVIVQTKWMKKKCIDILDYNKDKVIIRKPNINIQVNRIFLNSKVSLSTFFYPASGVFFKNHITIVNACLNLKNQDITNYSVIFTLTGYENNNIKKLVKTIKNNDLPIKFIGPLNRDEVFEFYSKSVLIFPSFIETVGLPLIEAKQHETPILASSCDFSIEILEAYTNVSYFSVRDSKMLSKLMLEKINYVSED